MIASLPQGFIEEVKQLALQIALQQCGENHLQSEEVLTTKFFAECREADHAQEIWDELPDLLYYATCLLALNGNDTCYYLIAGYLPEHVSMEQVMLATLKKYRRRAAGYSKGEI